MIALVGGNVGLYTTVFTFILVCLGEANEGRKERFIWGVSDEVRVINSQMGRLMSSKSLNLQ